MSTYSPYSRFGLGTLDERATAAQTGLGRATALWFDGYSINPENPASYSFATKTLFQIDGSMQFLTLNQGDLTETATLSGLNSVNLLFKKDGGKAAYSVGLNRFSNSGYVSEDFQSLENIGDVIYRYRGEGGIYKAHAGFSYVPFVSVSRNGLFEDLDTVSTMREKLNLRHVISFGVNFEYYFGEVENISETEFEDLSFFNTRQTSTQYMSDFTFNLGVQGQLNLFEKYVGGVYQNRLDFLFGANYVLGKDMSTDFDEITENYTGTLFETILDTVSFINGQRGFVSLPSKIGFGAGIKFKNKEDNAYFLLLNYNQRSWSNYKVQYGDLEEEPEGFQDSNNLSVAFQFSPSIEENDNLFQQMEYRLGFRTSNTYLNINGTSINEQAVSAGLKIPFRRSGGTKLYLGTEFGLRGSNENNLVEEQFTNINVGISFAPNVKWFQKQKYN